MSLKSELKNGAVLQCSNGCRLLKIDNTLLSLDDYGYLNLNSYDENLEFRRDSEWDIIRLNNNVKNGDACNNALLETNAKYILWTWKKEESLTKEEQEYLLSVIKPFKEHVSYIEKYENNYNGLIKIHITGMDNICLPILDTLKFKDMEYNKLYTLKELKLEGEVK